MGEEAVKLDSKRFERASIAALLLFVVLGLAAIAGTCIEAARAHTRSEQSR